MHDRVKLANDGRVLFFYGNFPGRPGPPPLTLTHLPITPGLAPLTLDRPPITLTFAPFTLTSLIVFFVQFSTENLILLKRE